ncbi:MAG: glycosyltransferase family 2 protein [Flavobacteriales bacterium]|jgi:putative colanic acid biosynthesis glycosyltransferase
MSGIVFSIIIPCYNAERSIALTLNSILNQTFKNYEVIIIDGNSNDHTIAIIESLLPSAIIISESDNGVYDAINKGIKKAAGKYIYIIGADDQLYHENTLSDIALITDERPDLIFGDVQYSNKQNLLVPDIHRSKWSNTIYWKNSLHQQGCFYKKEIFNHNSFNSNYKVLGDYDLHLFLFTNKCSAQKYPHIVAICEAQGLSKKFKFELYKEELTIKKNRLPYPLYLMNIIWVRLKYLAKNLF